MNQKFLERIHQIFPGVGISGYNEFTEAPAYADFRSDGPSVEMDLHLDTAEDQHLSFAQLRKLSRLLGTENIHVLGLNRDQIYVVAYQVDFKEKSLKAALHSATSNSAIRRIAVQAGIDPVKAVRRYGKS